MAPTQYRCQNLRASCMQHYALPAELDSFTQQLLLTHPYQATHHNDWCPHIVTQYDIFLSDVYTRIMKNLRLFLFICIFVRVKGWKIVRGGSIDLVHNKPRPGFGSSFFFSGLLLFIFFPLFFSPRQFVKGCPVIWILFTLNVR